MINRFSGEYAFLSNFWPWEGRILIGPPAPILWKGFEYPTAEHLYQAAKSTNPAVCATIRLKATPGEAKAYGKWIKLRPDWEEVKFRIMYDCVLAKFLQHEDLAKKLIATGSEELVEGNWWNDIVWGVCLKTNLGQNHLGKILMRVRQEIRQAIETSVPGFDPLTLEDFINS